MLAALSSAQRIASADSRDGRMGFMIVVDVSARRVTPCYALTQRGGRYKTDNLGRTQELSGGANSAV